MIMGAGALRHFVELQKPTASQDDFGEELQSWSGYAKVWASIEPLKGRELFAAQQISAETTIRVRLRYVADVASGHRVVYGTRILEINSIANPDERNKDLELMCKVIE